MYSIIQDMVAVLESLKEPSGLWSSRQRPEFIDLFTSANIIWFTKNTYELLSLKDEIRSSCEALKELLALKLTKYKNLHEMSDEDLFEVLQCATVLIKCCHELHGLEDKLRNLITENYDYAVNSVLRKFNPYILPLASLMTLVVVNLFDNQQSGDKVREVFEAYIEHLNTVPSMIEYPAIYWITETLKDICLNRDLGKELLEQHIDVVRNVEVKLSSILKETLVQNHVPLDRMLWTFLSLENLMKLYDKLGIIVDRFSLRGYNRLTKKILNIGRIKWIQSVYGHLLYKAKKENITIPVETFEKEADIDLITLSLLVKSYEEIGRNIFTYVTKHELKKLSSIEKTAFVTGLLLVILGTVLFVVSVAYWHLNVISLLSSIYLIGGGIYTHYLLIKGAIKSYRDLLKVLKWIFKMIK